MRRLVLPALAVLAWAATRGLLVAGALATSYPYHLAIIGDVDLYGQWLAILHHGGWPTGDPRWQYPPGAGLTLLAADALPGSLAVGLVVVLLVADAVVVATLLARAVRREGSLSGVWLWVGALWLLGPFVYARFDLVPAALAVVGLALAARPFLGGLLLGAGGLVKLWPAVLLPATYGRAAWRWALTGVAVAVGLVSAALVPLGLLGGSWHTFALNAGSRGLQLESIPATAWLAARLVGVRGITVENRYGALEVVGPGTAAAARVSTVLNVAVLLAYAAVAWQLRRTRGERERSGLALAAVLAVVVTARVLSPQYLVWVFAVAGVALTRRNSRLAAVGVLLPVVALLTAIVFPDHYPEAIGGGGVTTSLLIVRNVVLLGAAVLAVQRTVREPARPAGPLEPPPPRSPDARVRAGQAGELGL